MLQYTDCMCRLCAGMYYKLECCIDEDIWCFHMGLLLSLKSQFNILRHKASDSIKLTSWVNVQDKKTLKKREHKSRVVKLLTKAKV